MMHRVEQKTHARLRFVSRAGVRIQIRHMVSRLIAVRVLPNQAGNIGWRVWWKLGTLVEEIVQLANEALLAAKQFHVLMQVVLIEEGRLPRIAFGKIAPLF